MKWTCKKSQESLTKLPNHVPKPLQSYFPAENEKSLCAIHEKWKDIVTDYSVRHLTFAADRLVALAAITSQFARHCRFEPGDYVAGLWKPTILLDLLWYSSRPESADRFIPWIAPSWSWASVPGELQWLTGWWDKDPISASGTVKLVETKSARPELPFGAVTIGQLHIAGPVLEDILEPCADTLEFSFPHPPGIPMHYLTHYPDQTNFGESRASVEKMKVWLLELTSQVDEEWYGGYDAVSFTRTRRGLLLKKIGSRGQFCRIGVFRESIPVGAPSETFSESCDRCRKNSGETIMDAHVI